MVNNAGLSLGLSDLVEGDIEDWETMIDTNDIKISEIMPGMVNTEFSTVRFHGDKTKANNVYAGVEPLLAEDIADLIVYTANLPAHVNLAETLILPTARASPTKIRSFKKRWVFFSMSISIIGCTVL